MKECRLNIKRVKKSYLSLKFFDEIVVSFSLCGCPFFDVSIHISVGSSRKSNCGMISWFNVVGERECSRWWITNTESLTLNGEMLMC
jgi:hypothetical protein